MQSSHSNFQFSKKFAFISWGIIALYYIFQFIVRVSPSVMVNQLTEYFHLNANEFGYLCALSLYAYALLQIPTGILIDTVGIKKVALCSLFLCILGIGLFVSTDSYLIAQFARVCMGAGSVAAFLSASKAISLYFPPHLRTIMLSSTMTLGTIGALNGGMPLAYLVETYTWQSAFYILLILGLAITVLLLIFYRKENTANKKIANALHDFYFVLKSSQCWLYGFSALGLYICVSVLADLWGIEFMIQKFHISKTQAAQISSLIYVGLCVGSLTISFINSKIGYAKLCINICLIGILFSLSLIIYYPHLSYSSVSILLFLIGFLGGAEMIAFNSACQSMPSHLAATVTGFINTIVMLTGACFQQLVGKTLDDCWKGLCNINGLRIYGIYEYEQAISWIIYLLIITSISSFFIQQKNKK